VISQVGLVLGVVALDTEHSSLGEPSEGLFVVIGAYADGVRVGHHRHRSRLDGESRRFGMIESKPLLIGRAACRQVLVKRSLYVGHDALANQYSGHMGTADAFATGFGGDLFLGDFDSEIVESYHDTAVAVLAAVLKCLQAILKRSRPGLEEVDEHVHRSIGPIDG
jgi:hypothetical protein